MPGNCTYQDWWSGYVVGTDSGIIRWNPSSTRLCEAINNLTSNAVISFITDPVVKTISLKTERGLRHCKLNCRSLLVQIRQYYTMV